MDNIVLELLNLIAILCSNNQKLASILQSNNCSSDVESNGSGAKRQCHINCKINNDFTCKTCGKVFTYKSCLKDHYKKVSRCNEAFKKTQSIPQFTNHEECFICSACEYVTYSKRYFKVHRNFCLKSNQDEDGELCHLCEKFRSKSHSNMKRHQMSANCKKKRNSNDCQDDKVCNLCGIFRSNRYNNLQRHKKSGKCRNLRNRNGSLNVNQSQDQQVFRTPSLPPTSSAIIYTSTPIEDGECLLNNFSQDEHDNSQNITPHNDTTPEFGYEESISECDTTKNAVFSPIESVMNSDEEVNVSPLSVTPEIVFASEDATIPENGGIDKDQVMRLKKLNTLEYLKLTLFMLSRNVLDKEI